MILDAFINTALALLMTPRDDGAGVWWPFPPFMADIFVTGIIEAALTWLIVGVMVRNDMRQGTIVRLDSSLRTQTLPQLVADLPVLKVILGDYVSQLENRPLAEARSEDENVKQSYWRTLGVWIGGCLLLFTLPVMLVLMITSLATSSGKVSWKMTGYWKGFYGGLMGLFITPVAAFCALTFTPGPNANSCR